MKAWLKWMLVACAFPLLAACGGDDDDPAPGNIAQVAQRQGLTALLAAANKAGLASALSDSSASLTVFAPTDAAFGSMATTLGFASAGAMVEALPADVLAKILSYHVLGTRQTAASLVDGSQPATLYSFDGAPATLQVARGSTVSLTDAVLTSASVTKADVRASNGVVHVIDKVLVPPGVLNIVQMAQLNPAFSTLVAAVVQADLAATLSGTGPYTVFAPVNDAFAAIAGTVAGLTPQQLSTVLTYHVVAGQVLSTQIPFGAPVTTVSGQSITVNQSPLSITDTTSEAAPIVATDVRASNGVIHVIGKVLIPAL